MEVGLPVKIVAYLAYIWKAVIALAVPILWEGVIQIFSGLQGSFADNPIAVGVIGFILVFLKSNGPKPT